MTNRLCDPINVTAIWYTATQYYGRYQSRENNFLKDTYTGQNKDALAESWIWPLVDQILSDMHEIWISRNEVPHKTGKYGLHPRGGEEIIHEINQ